MQVVDAATTTSDTYHNSYDNNKGVPVFILIQEFHPRWGSAIWVPSGREMEALFDINDDIHRCNGFGWLDRVSLV